MRNAKLRKNNKGGPLVLKEWKKVSGVELVDFFDGVDFGEEKFEGVVIQIKDLKVSFGAGVDVYTGVLRWFDAEGGVPDINGYYDIKHRKVGYETTDSTDRKYGSSFGSNFIKNSGNDNLMLSSSGIEIEISSSVIEAGMSKAITTTAFIKSLVATSVIEGGFPPFGFTHNTHASKSVITAVSTNEMEKLVLQWGGGVSSTDIEYRIVRT
jgi:hypothetical protein